MTPSTYTLTKVQHSTLTVRHSSQTELMYLTQTLTLIEHGECKLDSHGARTQHQIQNITQMTQDPNAQTLTKTMH
jgi:hypothetical protein